MTQKSLNDHIEDFRDAMRASGVPYSGVIETDGVLRRIYVEGDKKGSRNGWFLFHGDDRPAGAFGSKKNGDSRFKWSAKGLAPLSDEERQQLAERQRRDREANQKAEAEKTAAAAALARQMWANAAESSDHPYLTRKGVPGYGLRVGDWIKTRKEDGTQFVAARNALLIPIKNGVEIVSLQAIFAKPIRIGETERDKDFVFGGQKRGCWTTIGQPSQFDGVLTIVIVEGYATGASIHRATGLGVVVAFDAGNLLPVAEAARRLLPDARIVICGDNDQWTGPTPENPHVIANPGAVAAAAAAKAVDGVAIIPHFDNVDTRPTDFNDLDVLAGPDVVAHQILTVLRPPVENPLEAEPAAAVDPDNAIAEYATPKTGNEQAGGTAPVDDDLVDTKGYFRVLGHDRDSIYVYQFEKRMITCRAETDWSENALITLAPLHWWEFEFPGEKGGINKRMAFNWLIRTAYSRGYFDPNSRRGRGAWRDDGRIVYHFGNEIWVDGKMLPVTSIDSSYVYEQARRLRHPAKTPLSGENGRKIVETAKLFHWTRPASALLLCGFVALGPICGALNWRPHIWLTGGAGSGKAQSHSEPVLTPDGWSTMGAMKVGAYVTTPDGGYGQVTGVYPQGVQPVWKLTFADGRTVRATGDHLWKVRIKEKWRLRTTDQLREILSRDSRQSTKLAVPLSEPVEIKGEDYRVNLPLHPYALGALLGDGCMGENADGSGTVGLTCFDPEIVDRINAVCSPEGLGLFSRGREGSYRFADLARHGRSTRAVIKDLRLIGTRSHDKFIPRAYLEASIADRIELLKGLMDTDGTICPNGSMSFCTVSPALRDGVVELVRSLGGIASVAEKQPSYTYAGEKRAGRLAYNVSIRLKDRTMAFYLPRKRERAAESYQYEDCLYLGVSSVEPDGEEECSCIAIDHPDRLYLTRDFTVTHNTTILKDWLWPLMNGCCIFAQGNSTEAGIRQTLRLDGLPVLFDETEQNNEREEQRVQAVMSLIRQSSTESEARTLKGTAGGDAQDFIIRSMFCLSSIQVGMNHQADFERVSVLALQPKKDDADAEKQAAENWAKLSAMLGDLRGDAELPSRLLKRSLVLLPKTLINIETFARAAAERFGSQREGDQYGTLIAGAWSLFSSELATLEQAKELIDRYDWGDYRENTETEESDKALGAMLGRLIRHKGGEVSVYELVEAVAFPNAADLVITPRDADAILRRHGLLVKSTGVGPGVGILIVSNKSYALKELMTGTAYAADLRGQLLRVPDAERYNETANFAGERSKGVAIPLYRVLHNVEKPRAPEPPVSTPHVDDDIAF